jgi:polyisoprenyl-phosphate glycosyltransferase
LNNYTFVIPLYNDWDSINVLLLKINKEFKLRKKQANILVINDASSEKINLNIKSHTCIKKVKILNLKKNVGSQKSIFIGLKYLKKNIKNSMIVVMDSDGEDDPAKLFQMINKAEKNNDSIIFARRTKRLEPLIFRILNLMRLLATYIFTGKYIDIGNYSVFSNKNLNSILANNNATLAYCSGVLKNCKKIEFVGVKKKKRYFGSSKVKLSFLITHSIKIISVFVNNLLLRSSIISILLIILFKNSNITYTIIFLLGAFNSICLFYNIIKNFDTATEKLIKNKLSF